MKNAACTLALICTLLAMPVHAVDLPALMPLIDPPQKIPPLVFEDADGQQHALADYRGHFVLLNIWATWCAPCVREMPSLEALAKQFDPHQLRVIPLSEDRAEAAVTVFYHTHALNHLPVAIDHAGIAPSALHLNGLPTSLLIDPQGQEIARIEGDADWAAPEIIKALRQKISGN